MVGDTSQVHNINEAYKVNSNVCKRCYTEIHFRKVNAPVVISDNTLLFMMAAVLVSLKYHVPIKKKRKTISYRVLAIILHVII